MQEERFLSNSAPTKKRIIKNLLVLSFAWVFLFTSYFSLLSLQSSLNSNANLGTTCLSVIFITLIVASFFFPVLLVRFLGIKWTLIVCQVGYLIYLLVNLYASWYTLIPGSILLGFSASAIWVAKNIYLKEIYLRETAHISQNGGDATNTLNRYMSLFYGFFHSCQIWANLLSSLILRPDTPKQSLLNNNISVNYSIYSNSSKPYCGAKACPWQLSEVSLIKPKMETVYILIGILAASVVISILINVIFLDNIKQTKVESLVTDDENVHPARTFLTQFINKYQLLITPFCLWVGLSQGFMTADFTKYFLACVFGIPKVGFLFMFFGIFQTIGCVFNGLLIKYIGRIGTILVGAVFYFPTLTFMLLWQNPNGDIKYVFIIVASVMGIAAAFWEPNVNAAIGIYFNKASKEAFSIYILWQSAGFFIAYLYSSYVCVWFKIYVLLVLGAVSLIGFLIIEFSRRRSTNKNLSKTLKTKN